MARQSAGSHADRRASAARQVFDNSKRADACICGARSLHLAVVNGMPREQFCSVSVRMNTFGYTPRDSCPKQSPRVLIKSSCPLDGHEGVPAISSRCLCFLRETARMMICVHRNATLGFSSQQAAKCFRRASIHWMLGLLFPLDHLHKQPRGKKRASVCFLKLNSPSKGSLTALPMNRVEAK